jgi:protein-S-isoprenylcysteine O-methyltransferase Ste14
MNFLKRSIHFATVTFWIVYGGIYIFLSLWNHSGLLQVIMSVNTLLFGYFLLVRRTGEPSPYPWVVQGIILGSIFLGNFYKFDQPVPLIGVGIGIFGSLVSLWALVSLGKSFGITPADRGLVMRGPYRFIRHPMYSGYLLIDIPMLIWNASPWNWMIFCIKLISFVIRILLEERVVSDYSMYKQKIRWRLIPLIW